MEDPYSVLGLNTSASDEELTQAYRRLAKKYHPDINPGDRNAELKMREVNEAYDRIKKQKAGGTAYDQTIPEMQQVLFFIQYRRYAEALGILSQIADHTGEWYFYSAIAYAGTGSRVNALSHARTAVQMDPDKASYRQLLAQLEQSSYSYRQAGERRGFNMQRLGSSLFRLVAAQLCCIFCCRCC